MSTSAHLRTQPLCLRFVVDLLGSSDINMSTDITERPSSNMDLILCQKHYLQATYSSGNNDGNMALLISLSSPSLNSTHNQDIYIRLWLVHHTDSLRIDLL